MAATEHWKTQPDEHDDPAAADYLSLGFTEHAAVAAVQALRRAAIAHRKVKDLLRAAHPTRTGRVSSVPGRASSQGFTSAPPTPMLDPHVVSP